MSKFNILALSGGGYKGLYSAKILKNLEEAMQEPVGRKFDLISGTSIGGILALAIALEVPARELVDLFEEKGELIFKPYKSPLKLFSKSKYPQYGLREALIDIFGDKKIGDLKHRVIIPTVNFTKGGIQVVKTSHHPSFTEDHKLKLVDVALATSAAPTFFPIHRMENGDFVDGGITANHPGLFAYIEAQKFLNADVENIQQLHIGTLSNKYTSPGDNKIVKSGFFQWKMKLISLIFSCQESSTDQIVKFLLQDRYCSIDHSVTDEQDKVIGLDKVDENAKRILIQCANISYQAFTGSSHYKMFTNHQPTKFIPFHKE